MKTGVIVTKLSDRIELLAVLMDHDYPVLDALDKAVVNSPMETGADMLQSMEILIRRAFEQGAQK